MKEPVCANCGKCVKVTRYGDLIHTNGYRGCNPESNHPDFYPVATLEKQEERFSDGSPVSLYENLQTLP